MKTKLNGFSAPATLRKLSPLLIAASLSLQTTALAQDPEGAANGELAAEQEEAYEEIRNASSETVRRFHEVLDELLAEFGFDVKKGQLSGLKNLAIRKVTVGNTLPRSYEKYMELLVAERIRENADVRLISCISCGVKKSQLIEGKIIITSPATNVNQLRLAADQLGIDHFMDVILVYHTTHMVLALQIFKVDTNEMVWARSYNSETIKSRYQKLAVDYSQVAKSRPGEEYSPEYRLLLGMGAAGIPNVGGTEQDSTMINVQMRAMEKFNNRKTEFGMMLSLFSTVSSVVKEYPKSEGTGEEDTQTVQEIADENNVTNPAKPEPFKTALGLYGVYSHVFLGAVESYNDIRTGIHTGIGGILATGYVAGAMRFGVDGYFGRTFVTSLALNYIAPSQVLVDNTTIKTKGGTGFDFVVSYNF